MTKKIFLVEIEGRLPVDKRGGDIDDSVPNIAVVTTGTKPLPEELPASIVIRGTTSKEFNTRPRETPPDVPYYPNLGSVGVYARHAFTVGRTQGAGTASPGEIVFVNGKQSRRDVAYLDQFRDYSFDGRPLTIRKGPERFSTDFRTPTTGEYINPPAYPESYPAIFSGTIRRVAWSLEEVRFTIRDRQGELSRRVLQPETYSGDNVATSTGIEGVEGDEQLEGQRKPVLFGVGRNIPVPNVNTSTLTYQISSRQIASVDAVYDRAVALTAGTTHASLAALQAATVTAGQYDAYLGANGDGAFIRVETQPEELTVDATAGTNADDRTIGSIVQEILNDPDLGDIPLIQIEGIGAVNQDVPFEAGLWLGLDDVTFGDALNRLLGSIFGWWLNRRDGVFEINRLKGPDITSSSGLLGESQVGDRVSDIRTQVGPAPDDGIVPRSVTAEYARNYLVQTSTAAGANADQVNFAKVEYRKKKSDLSTEEDWPLGEDLVYQTAFSTVSGAEWFNSNFTDLFGTRREVLAVRVHPSVAETWNIGDTLTLDIDRFDWTQKPVRLLGYTEDLGSGTNSGQTLLYVWG